MTVNVIKRAMKKTRIKTAIIILKERITPDKTRPVNAPIHEKILFLESRSAYSEGSALLRI